MPAKGSTGQNPFSTKKVAMVSDVSATAPKNSRAVAGVSAQLGSKSMRRAGASPVSPRPLPCMLITLSDTSTPSPPQVLPVRRLLLEVESIAEHKRLQRQ